MVVKLANELYTFLCGCDHCKYVIEAGYKQTSINISVVSDETEHGFNS